MKNRGFQTEVSRKTQIAKASLSLILSGKRRATPEQAEKLEKVFIENGIPLNRWDLLYGIERGETLDQYLKKREGK